MQLKELLKNTDIVKINADLETEISSITMYSGNVETKSAFFAIRGWKSDGNNYINDAVAAGAAVIITESPPPSDVPYILTDDVRRAMSIMSANFYGNRHKEMKMIAVVGTNGKTTTANMLASILKGAGKKVTLIGTLGAYINGKRAETELTTPDPILFHNIISESYALGVEYAVYEASAHAIYLRKTDGIVADIGIFTNFSQDHLDFFQDMESYKNVKKSFFTPEKCKYAILNTDDSLGMEIYNSRKIPCMAYGLNNPADTFAIDIKYGKGTECLINSSDDIFKLKTNFTGGFNLYNTLAAVSAAKALGISSAAIAETMRAMPPVEGRFNIISGKKRAVIDFAHTPDGLKNLLTVAKTMCKGRLIAVFGCGGDRDPKKRKIMGRIAGEIADFSILTSDNNRFENPNDIIRQIEQGFSDVSANYIKIVDREHAITYAMLLAAPEDLVVIAGKGGEEYMDEGGIKKPYSDKKVVEEIFRRYNL